MAKKNHITFGIIGILCVAIGSLLALYFFAPPPPSRNAHTTNEVFVSTGPSSASQVAPKAPEDRSASQKQAEEAYLHYLENLQLYLTPQNIGLFILTIGIVWAIISSLSDEEKNKLLGDPISNDDSNDDHRMGGDGKGTPIKLSDHNPDGNKGDKEPHTTITARTKPLSTALHKKTLSKGGDHSTEPEMSGSHKHTPLDTSTKAASTPDDTHVLQEVATPQKSTKERKYTQAPSKAWSIQPSRASKPLPSQKMHVRFAKTFGNHIADNRIGYLPHNGSGYDGANYLCWASISFYAYDPFATNKPLEGRTFMVNIKRIGLVITSKQSREAGDFLSGLNVGLASSFAAEDENALMDYAHALQVAPTRLVHHPILHTTPAMRSVCLVYQVYNGNIVACCVNRSMVDQLGVSPNAVASDPTKIGNRVKDSAQKRVKVNMAGMYYDYTAMPHLFSSDPKQTHGWLFDQIVATYPSANEIICENIDCIGTQYNDTSSALVCANFIAGLKDRLGTMGKNTNLTKIIIRTYKDEIACDLYNSQFAKLGWKVQKGSYFDYDYQYKNAQVSLTKKGIRALL